jgi:hypothetical protein
VQGLALARALDPPRQRVQPFSGLDPGQGRLPDDGIFDSVHRFRTDQLEPAAAGRQLVQPVQVVLDPGMRAAVTRESYQPCPPAQASEITPTPSV